MEQAARVQLRLHRTSVLRLSLVAMANKIGCSPSHLCWIEKGQRIPSRYKLRAAIRSLTGIPIEAWDEAEPKTEDHAA
jgi:transcriptional regulator with XRE-family HTH domain